MMRDFAKFLLLCILVTSLMVGSLPFFASAETVYPGGEITEDTTWTVAGSPYKIMGSLTVKNGTTLTIEPGVQVLFEEDVMLNIEGSLSANGTSAEKIEFKPIYVPIGPMIFEALWEGLKFVGESTDVFVVRFADVLYARHGVTVNSTGKVTIENTRIGASALDGIHVIGQADILDISVRNCEIKLNKNGVAATGDFLSGIQVVDNEIIDNENGINVQASGASCQITDIVLLNNTVSSSTGTSRLRRKGDGVRIFSNASYLGGEAKISEVAIIDNVVLQNLYGVYLYASGLASITDSLVSGNVFGFNNEGMRVFSGGNSSSWVSNVTVFENIVFSNTEGMSFEAAGSGALQYDCIVGRNIASANNLTGIEILGGIRVNLTENSVAYSSYGVVVKSQGNWARRNDIYANSVFGAYVEGSGTIDAVDNFWGSSSGPFHEYLNMDGLGNEVNGNGVNLRFDPFLVSPVGVFPINQPPVAKLSVAGVGAINESLVFDAGESSDDSRIASYIFDFGDGMASSGASAQVQHAYVVPGFYDASLTVMDDLGVLSRKVSVRINITLPILTVYVAMKPNFVLSGGNASVVVHVSNGSYAVENVTINVASDLGGVFEAVSGLTDANGDFEVLYFPPKVSRDTVAKITVAASKGGFINGSKQVLFPVLMPSSVSWLSSPWFWVGVVGAGVVVVVGVVLIRRRRSKHAARLQARRLARKNKQSPQT